MNGPGRHTHLAPFINVNVLMHGLDPGQVRIDGDDAHHAVYIHLDASIGIRIDLDDAPEDLDRDRAALRRLAELATQADQLIGQLQEDGTS